MVILRFAGSPVTSLTGNPAASARAASSVTTSRLRPAFTAARSTRTLNAWGVCARKTRSRGIVRSTSGAPSAGSRAYFTVSWHGSAASAAPVSTAAWRIRAIRSADTKGLAASWITTTSALDSTTANPLATES